MTSQRVQVAFRSWKRQGNELPTELQREPALLTFSLNSYYTFQISGLQDYKRINLCCLKLLSLLIFYSSNSKLIQYSEYEQISLALIPYLLGYQ